MNDQRRKTIKQLLWFVISSVIIIVIMLVSYSVTISQSDMPRWIGNREYMLLFFNSPEFSKVLLNTFVYLLTPSLMAGAAIFVLNLILKMKEQVYWSIMAIVSSLATFCYTVFYFKPKYLGLPYADYPAGTVVSKPQETAVTVLGMLKNVSVMDILFSFLAGILACFILWLITLVVKAIKNRI